MSQLSVEAKEAIVKKALSRGCKPMTEIAEECQVGYSTLMKWLKRYRDGQPMPEGRRGRSTEDQGQTPPLYHLLSTEGLDEQGIGAYCREQGIHRFQLTKWKEELMNQGKHDKRNDNAQKEIRALREENKNLKQELRRKDKALAETSALLILKKKANLIWGEPEDD